MDEIYYYLAKIMNTELYRLFKDIDTKKLTDDDQEELLRFFMVTKDNAIRNQIAFIFSDTNYEKAIPFIIRKINQKELFNYNGSLVYALQEFDLRKYFIQILKIICTQEYEARLMAYEIVIKTGPLISDKMKDKSLNILEEARLQLESSATDKGEDSALHFVEKTMEILQTRSPAMRS